jgi:hypothetical protein
MMMFRSEGLITRTMIERLRFRRSRDRLEQADAAT